MVSNPPPHARHNWLAGMADIFPVVQPHMARDERPVPDVWPYPYDGVRGTNADGWHVLIEPGAQFLAHDAHALRVVGLRLEPIDQGIQRGVIEQQLRRRLAMGRT